MSEFRRYALRMVVGELIIVALVVAGIHLLVLTGPSKNATMILAAVLGIIGGGLHLVLLRLVGRLQSPGDNTDNDSAES